MLKNILKTLQDTGDLVKEKATELNESAKEKIMSGIEEWVEILPKLKTIGLEMTAFGISMSCLLYTSPSPRDRPRSRMPSSA